MRRIDRIEVNGRRLLHHEGGLDVEKSYYDVVQCASQSFQNFHRLREQTKHADQLTATRWISPASTIDMTCVLTSECVVALGFLETEWRSATGSTRRDNLLNRTLGHFLDLRIA